MCDPINNSQLIVIFIINVQYSISICVSKEILVGNIARNNFRNYEIQFSLQIF